VRSTLHPAWAVLAKVHAGVACIRGVFQALVDRLTKSLDSTWYFPIKIKISENIKIINKTPDHDM